MEESAQKTIVATALAAVMVEVHVALFDNRVSAHRNRGNVSIPQLLLLMHLRCHGSINMTDISRKLAHSTAAATGLVDRLEKLKYVKRRYAADDRRKVFVEITETGLKYLKSYEEMLVSCISTTSEKEAQALISSVHAAAATLNVSPSGLGPELGQEAA